MKLSRLLAVALIGLAVTAPRAQAVQLPPNGSLTPFAGGDGLTALQFADLTSIAPVKSESQSISGGGFTLDTTLVSTVYSLGTATIYDGVAFAAGELVFGYQIFNNAASTTLLEHFNVTAFTEGQPAGGYVAKYFSTAGGDEVPDAVRSNTNPFAKLLGYDFTDGSRLVPGSQSVLVLIFTHATGYRAGNATLQDSGLSSANIDSYVPAPEPGTLALAAIALPLLGAGYLRRRRRQD